MGSAWNERTLAGSGHTLWDCVPVSVTMENSCSGRFFTNWSHHVLTPPCTTG